MSLPTQPPGAAEATGRAGVPLRTMASVCFRPSVHGLGQQGRQVPGSLLLLEFSNEWSKVVFTGKEVGEGRHGTK